VMSSNNMKTPVQTAIRVHHLRAMTCSPFLSSHSE
jgi:hypothetical protein